MGKYPLYRICDMVLFKEENGLNSCSPHCPALHYHVKQRLKSSP